MGKTTQDNIIGEHPQSPNIFGEWLTCTDLPSSPLKTHRKLEENKSKRSELIEKLALWIIKHHVTEGTLKFLEKRKILDKHKYKQDLQVLKPLPAFKDALTKDPSETQKGNAAEILLFEYLTETSKMNSFSIYKLRFSPNVDSAMKGDDILIYDEAFNSIILGESKFVSNVSSNGKKKILEIVSSLAPGKIPLSIEFAANIAENRGDLNLHHRLLESKIEIHDKKIKTKYAGFLMGPKALSPPGKDTFSQVEKHLQSSNSDLVFISLGLDTPIEIVFDSFQLAYKYLREDIEKIPVENEFIFLERISKAFKLESWVKSRIKV